MATISKYVLVGLDNVEQDVEYDTFNEARDAAVRAGNTAVLEVEYEYSDSSLVWAPGGTDRWPPEGE